MTLNQFTIGTEGAAAELLEFLKSVQPGDRIKLSLDNGVSKIDGVLLVDEHTGDRLAARVKMKGGQSLGGCEDADDEDNDEPEAAATPPKSGTGASVAAALGLKT